MKNCKRLLALVLCLALSLTMIPSAFAAQEDNYHDPAEHWLNASNRTNELDANATVTHETFNCAVCGKPTSFLAFRTPEYSRDGATAGTRNVRYSDGTLIGGSGTGMILDGNPEVDASYTGYHWTKAVCENCGTINSNMGVSDYCFGKNVYWLYDCAPAFTETLPTTVAFEYVDSTYHKTTTKGGTYCCFCFGTHHNDSSKMERHNMSTTIIPQIGNQRFATVSVCDDCGYTETDYTAAKSVIANYFGVVDGSAHTITVSDLSEGGITAKIRYGNSAESCTMTTAPSFTDEGQYTVYYEITYKYKTETMVENGVAYVWLRDEAKDSDLCTCGCGEAKDDCNCASNNCSHNCSSNSSCGTNHNFTLIETVNPTCHSLGYDRYMCLGCGKIEYRNYVNALNHSYKSIVIRDADCENEGKILNICITCNETTVVSTPKGDHSFKTYKVAATCTTPGYTVKECSNCGERSITDITAVLSHSYKSITTPATCDNGGHTLHICTGCGNSYIDNYVGALGHNWDNGKVIANATCTGESVTQYTCQNCGSIRIEGGAAAGHVPGEAATCTEPQLCTVCGAVIAKAIGHNTKATVTEPTCTTLGFTTYECANCDLTYKSDYTDVLGHDYQAVVTDPTCLEGGFTTYTCSRCGDSFVRNYTDALGHEFDQGVKITDATCESEGVVEYNCIRCPYHELHATSAKGHTPGEAANCTDPQTCTVCGAVLKKALGHNFEAEVTPATCEEIGYTTFTCTGCGGSYKTDYVLPIGHNYEGVVTPATCVEGGFTTYTCANCADSFIADYTDALGHEFGEGVKVLDSACTHDGVMEYDCIRCPYHELHAIEATGHTAGEAATCTDPQLCTVCGAVLENAKGHSYSSVITPATCTEMGYTTNTCDDCGHNYVSDYTDALGHKAGDWIVDKEPTTDYEGSKHKACETCGAILETVAIEKLYNSATTDTHGEAVVGGYLVTVTDTDTRNPISNASVVLNKDGSIAIRLPNSRVLDYADQTTLTVQLVKDKSPVKDMILSITDKNDNFCAGATDANGQLTVPGTSGVTNDDGKLTIGWNDINGKPYTFTIRVIDYENGRPIVGAGVTVNKSGVISVVLPDGVDMNKDNRIQIIVTDNTKKPVADMDASIKSDNDGTVTGKTDEDGSMIAPAITVIEKHTAIFVGYPDGTFGAERNMTRSEAAAIFARLLSAKNGDVISPVATTKFEDIPANAWYSGYVRYLSNYGVIYGTSDNKFSPNKAITRAEFTAMAVRFFAAYGDGNAEIMEKYADFSDVSAGYWAAEYIKDAAIHGWIIGYGDGTFGPNRCITRAEVATIVNRLLGHTADKEFINQNLRTLNTYTDLVNTHWAYYDIMEASNSHNADMTKVEVWFK